MKDGGASAQPAPGSRHERRAQRMQEHAARRLGAEGGPRVRAGHRIFLHERGEPLFGPGVYELLILVDETGSLHQAAKSMGMSYSKAWRVTRQAEVHLGVTLLERQIGGPNGGGSVLTEDGRQLIVRCTASTSATRPTLSLSTRPPKIARPATEYDLPGRPAACHLAPCHPGTRSAIVFRA